MATGFRVSGDVAHLCLSTPPRSTNVESGFSLMVRPVPGKRFPCISLSARSAWPHKRTGQLNSEQLNVMQLQTLRQCRGLHRQTWDIHPLTVHQCLQNLATTIEHGDWTWNIENHAPSDTLALQGACKYKTWDTHPLTMQELDGWVGIAPNSDRLGGRLAKLKSATNAQTAVDYRSSGVCDGASQLTLAYQA